MRTRLERLLAIEKEIRSERYPSVEDLCRAYSVKARTVYADISILRDRLGLDIEFDRSRNGYFNAAPSRTLPSFDLSVDECLLLICGCETLSASLGTGIKPLLNRVLEKIQERLPPARSINIALVQGVIQCSVNEKSDISPAVFLELLSACFGRNEIEVTKTVDTTNDAVVLEQCKLIELNKIWHLAGRVRGTDIVRQILLTDIIDYRFVSSADDNRLNLD